MRFILLATAALVSASPAFAQTQPQTGPFPLNSVTNQVHSGPQGEGLRASTQALQQTLTELQQLQLQTKQAHWNVSGTLFYPLHELLQEHYEGVAKYADEVAERLQGVGVSSEAARTRSSVPAAFRNFRAGLSTMRRSSNGSRAITA